MKDRNVGSDFMNANFLIRACYFSQKLKSGDFLKSRFSESLQFICLPPCTHSKRKFQSFLKEDGRG